MISKKALIVSVCIIALLVGAYFFLSFSDSNDNNTEPNITNQEVDKAVETSPIFEADKNSFVSLKFSNNNGTYEFFKDGETWKVKGFENIAFNQSSVNTTMFDYVSLKPVLVVEKNPSDTASYGFDSPLAQAEVQTSDGRSAVFYLGDETKGGNGYYFMMQGDNTVYTVSSVIGNNMQKKLIEYRDIAVVDVAADDIKEITMTVQGVGEVHITHLDEQMDVMTSWKMTSPYEIGIYDDKFSESVLEPITSVEISQFVSDNPTDEQLEKSGFNNPKYFYEIKTSEKEYKVIIGGNYDGYFIAKREDVPSVYLISADALGFLFTDIFDYIHSYPYLPHKDTISEIACNIESVDYKVSIERQNEEEKLFINNNRINNEKFSDFYQKLFGIPIKGSVTTPGNPNDVVFSYTVTKADGTTDKISYVNMNGKYMYLYVNGKAEFYVYADDVKNAMNSFSELYELSSEPYTEEENVAKSDDADNKKFNWIALLVVAFVMILIAAFPVSMLISSKKKNNK